MTSPSHGHVITLEHLRSDAQQWSCRCGEWGVGLPKVVRAQMMGHRMQAFPKVRARLLA